MPPLLPTREERLEFLQQRQQGLGSSDIPAILGLSRFKSPMDVYLSKVRPVEQQEADSIDILRGLLLEDVFATLYCEHEGQSVRRMGQRSHPELSWATVNADRQILDKSENGDGPGTGALEIKSVRSQTYQKLLDEGLFDSWIVQGQWQLFVTGYDWGAFAVGNLEHDRGPMVSFPFVPDDTMIGAILPSAERFWTEHVEPRVPPHPDEWSPPRVEVPAEAGGDRVTLDSPEAKQLARSLMDAYEIRNEAKDLYQAKREQVEAYLEAHGAEKVKVPGQGKINYAWSKGRLRFDKKRLKKYAPLDPDKVRERLTAALAERDPVLEPESFIEDLIEECRLDFSLFETRGDAYRRFRPYPADERERPPFNTGEGDDG